METSFLLSFFFLRITFLTSAIDRSNARIYILWLREISSSLIMYLYCHFPHILVSRSQNGYKTGLDYIITAAQELLLGSCQIDIIFVLSAAISLSIFRMKALLSLTLDIHPNSTKQIPRLSIESQNLYFFSN